jgi:hypothetical protein
VLYLIAQVLSLPEAWHATMHVGAPAHETPRGGADDVTATE